MICDFLTSDGCERACSQCTDAAKAKLGKISLKYDFDRVESVPFIPLIGTLHSVKPLKVLPCLKYITETMTNENIDGVSLYNRYFPSAPLSFWIIFLRKSSPAL